MSEATPSKFLLCTIVTPEATVHEQQANFVALPLYDGEKGVGVNHSPLIGRLGYGELRIRHGDSTRHFYVDGGFVQVVDNVVSVLTNRAIPAEKLKLDEAQQQLATVIARRPQGEEEIAIRDRLLRQARAQLRTAERAHG